MGTRFLEVCRSIKGYVKTDKSSVRQLLLSLISLVIVLSVLITMTYSWFTIKSSTLKANTYELDCGKGLRVNDSGTSQLTFSKTNAELIPASSVDGRNLFFPTDGSDFSSTTKYMTFRSSNVGDKNQHYIQIDFTLTAQQNHTALYINPDKTSLRVAEPLAAGQTEHNENDWSIPKAACLRSALWCSTQEEGVPNTPIVFNPTATTVRTAAVEDVDRATGAFISSGRQVAHAFSEYAYGGLPVASLSSNVVTKFSYIVWLEGTDPKCTDKIVDKDIEIRLGFKTSWDNTQNIRFEDQISNKGDIKIWREGLTDATHKLSLVYSNPNDPDDETEFNMYSYNNNENVWSCNIPGDMTNKISFVLRPINPSGTTYEFTKDFNDSSKTTYDRGADRMYVAKTINSTVNQNTKIADSCAGYWRAVGDSDGAGHDSGDLDGDDF